MSYTTSKWCALVSGFALLASCHTDGVHSVWPTTQPMVVKKASVDAQALGDLVVLNKSEMAAATVAKGRAHRMAVKNYAAYLYQQHAKNLHQTIAFSQEASIEPVMNKTSLELEQQSKQGLAQLNAASSDDFDRVYLAAMVKGHQNALKLLDQIIPKVHDFKMKLFLQDTRHHVAGHLLKAKQLQKGL